jgi:hypothetical protein
MTKSIKASFYPKPFSEPASSAPCSLKSRSGFSFNHPEIWPFAWALFDPIYNNALKMQYKRPEIRAHIVVEKLFFSI